MVHASGSIMRLTTSHKAASRYLSLSQIIVCLELHTLFAAGTPLEFAACTALGLAACIVLGFAACTVLGFAARTVLGFAACTV